MLASSKKSNENSFDTLKKNVQPKLFVTFAAFCSNFLCGLLFRRFRPHRCDGAVDRVKTM